jgi:hypothetical protein
MSTKWSRPSKSSYAAVGAAVLAAVLALVLAACTKGPVRPQPTPTSRPVVAIDDSNYCPTRMSPQTNRSVTSAVADAVEFCRGWVDATKVELLYLHTVVSTQSDGVVNGLDADLKEWFSDDARHEIEGLAPRPSHKDQNDPGHIFDFDHIQALHIVYGGEGLDYGGHIVTVYETWRVQTCRDQVVPSGECRAIGSPSYADPRGASVGGGPGITHNQYYLLRQTQPNKYKNHFIVNRIRRGIG